MGQNGNNRMRMLVILVWSGNFCLSPVFTTAESVHPSSTKTQTQFVDRINQKSLSSDQTSLQPEALDATETDASQTIEDNSKPFLVSDSDNRDREKDDNWTDYSPVLPDFEYNGMEANVERLGNGGVYSDFGKQDSDVEKRTWKGSERLGKKEGGKRKWSPTNLAMWGKRKWSANKMAMWGKRDAAQTGKRKWNGNSMAMWGKRDLNGQELDEEKRKWNGNSMAMWGKRDLNGQELDEEKRKWNGNSMAMWGKRDAVENGSKEPEWQRVVRGWSGRNLAMWGKRDIAKKVSH